MLKDHGSIRPSVFEVLTEVHHMRGTKSQFQYNVPTPEPLSPSRLPYPKQPVLDGVITYRSPRSPQRPQNNTSVPPVMNQGQLAREKVMEAIAPMRRGRPTPSRDSPRDLGPGSRPDSPQKEAQRPNLMGGKVNEVIFNEGNLAEDERAWKTWTPESRHAIKPLIPNDDAWKIENDKENIQVNLPATGFNDNFTERLRMSVEMAPKGTASQKTPGLPPSFSKESSIPIRSTPQAAIGILQRKIPLPRNEKDAFDGLGLGLPSERPELTLGEARKLRTGLATMSSPRLVRLEPESRPLASPKPTFLTPQAHMQTQGFLSTSPSTSSTGSATQGVSRPSSSIDGMPIESRFPSLEELDATLSATSSKSPRQPFSAKSTNVSRSVKYPNTPEKSIPDNARSTTPAKASASAVPEKQGSSHTRILELGNDTGDSLRLDKAKALPSTLVGAPTPRRVSSLSLKPTVTRRQRASISFKHKPTADEDDEATPSQPFFSSKEETPLYPQTNPSRTSPQPRDWLTGDENLPPTATKSSNSEMPILRRSPSKHASVIEKSGILISEGIAAQPERASVLAQAQGNELASTIEISPTIAKFTQLFPPIETAGKGLLAEPRKTTMVEEIDSSSSSADEGPEDVNGPTVAANPRPLTRSSRRQTRQSSVHDLVDLWGGTSQPSKDVAQSNTGDDKVLRRRQRIVEPPPESKETPTSKARNSSPELKTPVYLEPTKQPINVDSKRQVASGRTSPSPIGRPRPQSLFLYPSKSADSSFQQSNLLDAPPDARRLQNRRNSITDMVERYEAMGSNSVPTGPRSRSPSPLLVKTTNSKSASKQESGHFSKPLDTGASLALPPSPSTPAGKQRPSPTRTKGFTGFPLSSADRRSPLDAHKSDQPEGRGMNAAGTDIPRSRKLSLKPHENPKPPVSLQELLAADDRKEKPSAAADRSPSTERAYKGVGKLIDQWQRKAEEAEPGRTAVGAKRISITTKRPAAAIGKPQ